MKPHDPRIERITHSGMFSVFTVGEGYSRFDTLEDAQAFLGQFMQPEIVGPETFYDTGDGWNPEPTEDGPQETAHGYFARLSASGYLDCTKWGGPFETEAEAARYLIDTYGNED